MGSKIIDKAIAAREVLVKAPGHLKRSFLRAGYPTTPFERAKIMTSNFFLHIHPPRVHLHSLEPAYTLGLGVITVSLFAILCITGFLLMFYYVPAVESAYSKMQDLIFVVSFGRLVRNLHRWTSDGMVIVVFLHMCRVFYTGAYKPPREFNWLVGVALLLLTLVASFTGYLLPWDQLSFWAVTVATEIIGYIPLLGERVRFLLLGGSSVGGETLVRFYAFHVALIPLALAILISYHLWRIRKDGGLARPRESEQEKRKKTVLSFPRLVYIEISILLGVSIIFLLISLLFDAPLGGIANPEFPPNPAKAPWFFLGLQELV
ncbi:MAG: cytochrome b N-terminal domain-containing protein, partial [Anaerolineae bacterium]